MGERIMKNISKERRENLLAKIGKLRLFMEQNNATPEMRAYLSELETELKRQKFGLVFEEHREEIDEILETHTPILTEEKERFIDGSGCINFLIEGDNLAALSLLDKTHRGKIDIIYIDPPYNTGAKTWKYDNDYVDSKDLFRHSKWLSMMSRRIEIAKRLLRKDGVFICAIDENELHTLGLLIENIFGEKYEIHCITIVHNPRGIQGKNFSYTNEYAIFVVPKGDKIISDRKIPENEKDWSSLRNWGGESLRTDARNCFYPIFVKDDAIIGFGDVTDESDHPKQNEFCDGIIHIYPIDIHGVERKWRYARQTVESISSNLRVRKIRGRYEVEIGKDFEAYRTVWNDSRHDSNEYGKKMVNNLVPDSEFDFPKSLYNVYDCIYSIASKRGESVILDFFAGSGTTGHAVMELNKEDGGDRKFILCTNNENNICRDVTYQRLKTVITGKRKDGTTYSEPINASLKYQKIEFLSTAEQTYYDYADQLLKHVKEIVELENAINFDGNTELAILLTEDEAEAFFGDATKLNTVRTIYLGHDVSLTSEQQKTVDENSITINVIPEYYYKEKQT